MGWWEEKSVNVQKKRAIRREKVSGLSELVEGQIAARSWVYQSPEWIKK